MAGYRRPDLFFAKISSYKSTVTPLLRTAKISRVSIYHAYFLFIFFFLPQITGVKAVTAVIDPWTIYDHRRSSDHRTM